MTEMLRLTLSLAETIVKLICIEGYSIAVGVRSYGSGQCYCSECDRACEVYDVRAKPWSWRTLDVGAVRCPIGGTSANCVIAGHCGWNGTKKFRYIKDLVPGDVIRITNPWETLTYAVTETKIISPDEFNEVLIRPGKDMITLATCHPYASDGTYRLLVYAERVAE